MSNEQYWRKDLDRALAALPPDTPEWAKAMMNLTLEIAVAQIKHTDANTRGALQEQDERLKDTIAETNAETRAELGAQMSGLEVAVNRQDRGFSVLEGLLEQNNAALADTNEALSGLTRWLRLAIYGVAGLSAIVLVLVIVLLARAVLLPSDLLWMAGAILAFSAGLTLIWFWRRKRG